ncbi:MAG: CapA family protein [Phycisphaeraceae bacterium]|nr:CapA family protein [Phycisphaeraceae bacterium]
MILLGDICPGAWPSRMDFGDAWVLCNLEGPVWDRATPPTPAAKAGPTLYSGTLPMTSGPVAASLANNHLMDLGAEGLTSTMVQLALRRWVGVGAGGSLEEARRPIMIDDHGTRVAVIACAEAQFGVATAQRAGVAELGPWVHGAIARAREQADAVVVSVHAALEAAPWPAPWQRELYRSWIDAGAAVVHGHHAHVPQGYEHYRDGLIFYGLGNALVDPAAWKDRPHGLWSVGADVRWSHNRPKAELLAFRCVERDGCLMLEPRGLAEAEVTEYWRDAMAPLKDQTLLHGLWQESAIRGYEHHYRQYLRLGGVGGRASVRPSWWSSLRRIGKAETAQPPRNWDLLLWHVLLACPSHQHAIAEALGVLGGERSDYRTKQTRELADRHMPWSVTPPSGREAA